MWHNSDTFSSQIILMSAIHEMKDVAQLSFLTNHSILMTAASHEIKDVTHSDILPSQIIQMYADIHEIKDVVQLRYLTQSQYPDVCCLS